MEESSFTVESMELGNLQTNCYIVAENSTRKAVVIDPADEGNRILHTVLDRGWVLEKILLTHGHYDHIGGLNAIRKQIDVEVWIHRADAEMLVDAVKNLSLFVGSAYTSSEANGFLIDCLGVNRWGSVLQKLRLFIHRVTHRVV